MAKPPALDLDHYVTYSLSVIDNMLALGAYRIYRKRFGVNVTEWRVLGSLALFAPMTANDICLLTRTDKAPISRAIARLMAAGMVKREADPRDKRRILLALAPKGRATHDRILPIALEREQKLLAALTPDEADEFRRILKKLRRQAATLDGHRPPPHLKD
ncbi:MAG TPA: MarR family winged helix-turn-helix transcriptional regulator [Alphaproteobacteria bacterium]|nr:MarR family winged helix-turn-helix transcriptional regulator [Alphaproteobacteria bacterium]